MLMLLIATAFAAKNAGEVEYTHANLQQDEVAIEVKGPHANDAQFKVAVALRNTGGDFIVADAAKMTRGGQAPVDTAKRVIAPGKKTSVTLNYPGDHRDPTQELAVTGLQRVAANGAPIPAGAFAIPANNQVKAGPVHCRVDKAKQETKETLLKFTCTSTEVALIHQHAATAEVYGQRFGNDAAAKTLVVLPGQPQKLVVELHIPARVADMQFTPIAIDFGGVFELPTVTQLETASASLVAFQE